MPATEQIVVTLSTDVLDVVRSRVKSGSFSNESDVIEQAIVGSILPPVDESSFEQWIRTEGIRRYDAMRADPSRALTEEEAFAGLCDDKA